MALGSQLPVRLDQDTDSRLEAAAASAGTSKSALIRLLAKTFVDQAVSADGSVTLPPRWADLLPGADGRSALMIAEQTGGEGNVIDQSLSSSASDVPARKPVSYKAPRKRSAGTSKSTKKKGKEK